VDLDHAQNDLNSGLSTF